MRREGITEVLDIGCGEGELLACLCNPAPWLAPPPQDVLPPATASDAGDDAAYTAVLEELHRTILHPRKISGLDICEDDLKCTVRITQPPPPPQDEETKSVWYRVPARWEDLEVNIWQGSLEHANPAFMDVECIVATEVIEHLPEPVLDRFAPVILGAYRPRFLLITTPSYTFNARFTAPDAPPSARQGYPDPTGRTDRVFRHHDHKFEWTVDEFRAWCIAVAEEWGYEVVEFGGVGTAVEQDEWGRDEQLGYASQVAAFRRREGEEWDARRVRRWMEVEMTRKSMARGAGETAGTHHLLAAYQHPAHELSGRPQPLDVVGELVVSKMVRFRETSVSLNEIWFESEIERACGGWLDWLVRAIQIHEGLALHQTPLGSSTFNEWVIQLAPALHHFIPPESHADAWGTPPDTDEVEDLGDPFDDDDTLWMEDDGGGLVKGAGSGTGDETAYSEWGAAEVSARRDVDWGEPDSDGWGKVVDPAAWGAPEGGRTWGEW
ncbi:hypothetical protein L226DRAFT_534941 [Lentinus tigrinus ALCF2SS1-7]|nr:hypothetical protein L226DRAFT_534941 [Lentinus tigrinus ALCF2SS1-7]